MEKGLEWYDTPIDIWFSVSLLEVQRKGGNIVSLKEYNEQKNTCEDELMKRLDEYQNSAN